MAMEEIPVVIVGAGPSGLAMGLSLARHKVKSVILEKELEITTDPRAVYLNGDAVRILWDLGLRGQIQVIGHVENNVNFHRTTFLTKPFYSVDLTEDVLNQALPMGIAHAQPKLESALVGLISASPFCELRRGCTVERHELLANGMTVGYTDQQQIEHSIKCSWLIGADGKRGVVRKRFLEPEAGIKQEEGRYTYEGTWIATNLEFIPPTAQSHPQLPFWDLGMTPEEVCDLYWPKGWHFCTPPGKPTACGRFGPYKDRLWRHEFAEPNWKESMDSMALFWDHITPMITREKTNSGQRFPQGPVVFPRDCISIIRCRPFVFAQKCVNKWFDKRRVLIGDSAHVFPPFGGEGMSSGLRDAHQLAWRIALVQQAFGLSESAIGRLLDGWQAERRQGIRDAVTFTKINGMLCNEPESWGFFVYRHVQHMVKVLPSPLRSTHPRTLHEAKGFRKVDGGFFLPQFNGGGKLAQVFVEPKSGHPFRSDDLLRRSDSLFTILVIGPRGGARCVEAASMLDRIRILSIVLSSKSIINVDQHVEMGSKNTGNKQSSYETFRTTDHVARDIISDVSNYSPEPYLERLGPMTVYAVLRPDFYIFALLKDISELERCLIELKRMLE